MSEEKLMSPPAEADATAPDNTLAANCGRHEARCMLVAWGEIEREQRCAAIANAR
jgi:hypothetical protein